MTTGKKKTKKSKITNKNYKPQKSTGFKGIQGPGPGRPVGSKNKISREILQNYYDDHHKHGKKVLARVRKNQPLGYLKLGHDMVEKKVQLDVSESVLEFLDRLADEPED